MTANIQPLLQSWSPPIVVNASLFLLILVYTRGWIRVRAVSPGLIRPARFIAFVAGIAAIWLAIGSPLEAFDDVSLTVHMVQHLLLMTFAPPLILLGAPALPLLQGIPHAINRCVTGPFLRSRLVKSFTHAATHPVICWLAAALALIVWHLPPVFELALRWEWLHELEHASFLITGLLFWWPVVQPWPSAHRWPQWSIPLYLFAATFPCDVLSGFLVFCDRVVYSSYLSVPPLFGFSPLQDQECAASLMWVAVTLIFLIPAILVTMRILSPAELHQEARSGPSAVGNEFLRGQGLETF
jgi:putative membrane protein